MTTTDAGPATLAEQYLHTLCALPGAAAQLRDAAARAAVDPALQAHHLLSRPVFLLPAERLALERDLAALQALLLSLPDRVHGGDVRAMCTELGFSEPQVRAVERTWRDQEVLLARADLMRTGAGWQAVELNLHSSLGGIDSGPWHRLHLDAPAFGEFAARHGLGFTDPLDAVAGELRRVARSRGLSAFPTLAVVDWPTSYGGLQRRLDRLCTMLQRRGFDAFSCHAGELALTGGRLRARGRPVELVHRVFVLDDLRHDAGLAEPLLAAHARGAVALVMGFVAELVGNKGCLAMLWDPRYAPSFTAAERALVARLVPATRWARDHRPRDLGPGREELVLKPSSGYGSSGVRLGWTTSEKAWRRAVTADHDVPHVLQERVRAVPELVPVPDGDGVALVPYDVNWGVFLAGGRYAGTMARALPAADQRAITTSAGAAVAGCFGPRE